MPLRVDGADSSRSKRKFPKREGPVYEDGSFRVEGGRTYDPEENRYRPVMRLPRNPTPRGRVVLKMTPEQKRRNQQDPFADFLKDVGTAVKFNVQSNIPGTKQWGQRRKAEAAQAARGKRLEDMPRGELALGPKAFQTFLKAGELMLKAKKPKLNEFGTSESVEDMLEGLTSLEKGVGRPGRAYRLPKRVSEFDTQDVGFAHRIPFVADKETGTVYVGRQGDVHAQLMSELRGRGWGGDLPQPGGWGRINQGWVVHPTQDAIRIELGHGATVGREAPKDPRGIEQLARWITRDYDDADIMYRLNSPRISPHERQRAMEAWIEDVEDAARMDAASPKSLSIQDYASFVSKEKMRKKRKQEKFDDQIEQGRKIKKRRTEKQEFLGTSESPKMWFDETGALRKRGPDLDRMSEDELWDRMDELHAEWQHWAGNREWAELAEGRHEVARNIERIKKQADEVERRLANMQQGHRRGSR